MHCPKVSSAAGDDGNDSNTRDSSGSHLSTSNAPGEKEKHISVGEAHALPLQPPLRPPPPEGPSLAGVVVVGCGEVASLYVGCLTSSTATTLITGVCDVDLMRACELARVADEAQERIYADVPKCVACTTVEDLVAALPPARRRIALNLTPTEFHAPVTASLLRAGFNVWTEKPIAPTHAEVIKLLAQRVPGDCATLCVLHPCTQISRPSIYHTHTHTHTY